MVARHFEIELVALDLREPAGDHHCAARRGRRQTTHSAVQPVGDRAQSEWDFGAGTKALHAALSDVLARIATP